MHKHVLSTSLTRGILVLCYRECEREGAAFPNSSEGGSRGGGGGSTTVASSRGSRGSSGLNGLGGGSHNNNGNNAGTPAAAQPTSNNTNSGISSSNVNNGSGTLNITSSTNNIESISGSGIVGGTGAGGRSSSSVGIGGGGSSIGGGSSSVGGFGGSEPTATVGGVSGGGAEMGGASRVTSTTTGRRAAQRLPSLRLANGRVAAVPAPLTGSADEDEVVRSPRSVAAAAALKEDNIKISLDTTTCTDSLITAVEDETAFVNDFISHEMNYKEPGKVHFGGDEISLYGTPKEEMVPSQVPTAPPTPGVEPKPSFLKNQLQALFQPTDNKLAMKLFGSKKALMKERIRQKAAGHWIIHPCSNFR